MDFGLPFFFFNYLFGCMQDLVKSFSHVQLFATLWTVAHQAPLSMGFSGQEHWSGVPFPSPGALFLRGIWSTPKASLLPDMQRDAVLWVALSWMMQLLPIPGLCSFPSYFLFSPASKFPLISFANQLIDLSFSNLHLHGLPSTFKELIRIFSQTEVNLVSGKHSGANFKIVIFHCAIIIL